MLVTQTYNGSDGCVKTATERSPRAVARPVAGVRDSVQYAQDVQGVLDARVLTRGRGTRRPLPLKATGTGSFFSASNFSAMGLVVAAVLGLLITATPASVNAQQFVTTRAAFEQGIEAYRAAYYEIAIPALGYAAKKGSFVAKYYLARIYADPQGAFTDHAKAYQLYLEIARDNLDVDPDVDRRAIVVAKSLTAVAGYLRHGLPSIGLRPDPKKAAGYLRQSAVQYGDRDAQFELAKLYLSGVGVRKDIKLARHFLSVLTQKGHAGAQAFLADLLWRGKYVKQDQAKALALISMAMANAPDYERFWIEDIYQNIYCGTTTGTRRQATGFVAVWKKQYGQIVPGRKRQRTAELDVPVAERTCADGEPVIPALLKEPKKATPRDTAPTPTTKSPTSGSLHSDEPQIANDIVAPRPQPVMRGFMSGFSLRDIGAARPAGQ